MSLATVADHLAIAAFLGLLACLAVSDLKRYLIPNRLCLGLLLLYPAHAMAAPSVDWAGGLLAAAAVFAVGWAAFAARLAGGGDVKMLTATALWAGPALLPGLLLVTGLAGGLLALLILAEARLVPRAAAAAELTATRQVPYGLAIAAGGAHVAWRLLVPA